MAHDSREQMVTKARPKRVPVFEANRNKITVAGLDTENFHYRWVNDVDDRLGMFIQGGWEFVDKHGKKVGDDDIETTKGLGTALNRSMGRGVTAYLMRIPLEWWKEDQARKLKEQINIQTDLMRKQAEKVGDYGSVKIEIKNQQ